jgi:hypothetical protein
MSEIETFGVTLPVSTWQDLFYLSFRADRSPSDLLRMMIAERTKQEPSRNPEPQPAEEIQANAN